MTLRLCAVLTAAFVLTVPAAAQARDLLDTTLTASTAHDRDCTTRLLGTKAQPTAKLTAPAGGWLTARLEGDGPGDWDLAIFEPETGRLVAGSAQYGSVETAQGIVGTGTAEAGKTLSAKGLRKGDYKVRITVKRAGSQTATSTLTSRKL